MKKFYGACIALALSLMFVFSGCTSNSSRVLNYLKEGKTFCEKPSNSAEYKVSLTVNEDLTYVLSVSYGSDALKNFEAEGPKLEYLGCYERHFTSEWLGVTQNNTSYYHVVKLPEATVSINDEVNEFYLVAYTISKRSDSYSLSLVYYNWMTNFNTDTNLEKISNKQPSFSIYKT